MAAAVALVQPEAIHQEQVQAIHQQMRRQEEKAVMEL
jgi:hypothetical protein